MRLEPARPVSQVAVEVGELRRFVDPPAAVVDLCRRHIDRPVADLLAELKLLLRAVERAAAKIGLDALPGEAVLHRHVERAAESIEAEDRVARDDRHLVDRIGGDQIPVDRVAESFVDAHAILIDGEANRRSGDRRRVEAAVADVGLKVVARDIADGDPGRLARQRLSDRQIVESLDVLGARLPDGAWNLRHVDLAAAQRRSRHDIEGWKLDSLCLCFNRPRREKGESERATGHGR